MLENASQAIAGVLLHRRSFGIPHRMCAASQRVAGPIYSSLKLMICIVISDTEEALF